jgi:cupin superfamily acireductone dioxygenase involved in methionine salvage
MAYDEKEEEKEMEAAKEDAPKEIEAEAVAENAPIAEEVAEDTAAPDANELQEKFDALVEENGKLKSDLATIMAEKVKAEEDLVTMSKQTPAAAAIVDLPIEVKMTAEEARLDKFKRQHLK